MYISRVNNGVVVLPYDTRNVKTCLSLFWGQDDSYDTAIVKIIQEM